MRTEKRVVDNRVFLVGLDQLYRSAMKTHERGELLKFAKQVADDLSIAPANVPVEGYYTEDESLTTYFRYVRALQVVSIERESEIRHDLAYRRIREVTESPIFGVPLDTGQLLNQGQDALFNALLATRNDWNVDAITLHAYESASASGEYSLVALAALAQDPIVLAALRESVVLYAAVFARGRAPTPKYQWTVDPILEQRARQFVDEFNCLFSETLPRPCRKNASAFWDACDLHGLLGRCVRIGIDDSTAPAKNYHWIIDHDESGQLAVSDFWDTDLWTTTRYREHKGYRDWDRNWN
jgi:hypothetical protein